MTPLEAAARVLELDGRATPGPWFWNHIGDDLNAEAEHGPPWWGARGLLTLSEDYAGISAYADGSYIAESRTLAPLLARAVQEQAREIERLKRVVRESHVAISADGGVTEHDCACDVCSEPEATR